MNCLCFSFNQIITPFFFKEKSKFFKLKKLENNFTFNKKELVFFIKENPVEFSIVKKCCKKK